MRDIEQHCFVAECMLLGFTGSFEVLELMKSAGLEVSILTASLNERVRACSS
jgi:hypothetical protein